jgi:hypothetical protein
LQIEYPYQIIGLECCILLQRELSGNIGAIGNVNFFYHLYSSLNVGGIPLACPFYLLFAYDNIR